MRNISNAIRLRENTAESFGPCLAGSVFDVAVVGAGPLGLAVAHRLSRRGLGVCLLEAERVGNTVQRYPEGLVLLSPAANLILEDRPLPGKAREDSVRREELLEYLESFAQTLSVDLRSPCRVDRIIPHDGHNELVCEAPTAVSVRARFVVVATGSFARPHWIGVEGEDGPRVHHSYSAYEDFAGRRCLVVGGRNSALTTVASLLGAGADVTLVHRKPDLERAWPHLREPVLRAAARGELRLLLDSRVASFGEADARVVSVAGGESELISFDAAFVMTGFDPDLDLFARSGITLDARTGAPELDAATQETSLAGVFVAGPASAGKQDDVQIYIHTSLPQVTLIADAIVSRLALRSQGNDE
jgi:thioredoxin reductase (NADPH)